MPAYDSVPAEPVKSFFVDMLTRDIALSDAVLDLLDNCVDRIIRSADAKPTGEKPYEGFWANIEFDEASFEISDNCGGIPWDLHEYVWRMGNANPKRDSSLPTVGTYEIGMKRALFKIGTNCTVSTQNGKHRYDVKITKRWLGQENEWKIPVQEGASRWDEDGTQIFVSGLRDSVSSVFADNKALFEGDLRKKIATHYAFIIAKGFEVKLNGKVVTPKPTEFKLEDGTKKLGIRPFIYRAQKDGVKIFLAVGLTHPIPSVDDVEAEQEKAQYSSLDAGWTVVCNDRAVLYCDRTELTGWGEAGTPKYHTQFISIAGIVEFQSNDARKLPTTTTKRGIDASSTLYLQVKNKMREGMQISPILPINGRDAS